MKDTVIVEKEALNLPEIDRALLANRLIESLSSPPDHILKAWAEEADSRSDAYRTGKISATDGPKAVAELKSRYSE